jgi:hypothetical protein
MIAGNSLQDKNKESYVQIHDRMPGKFVGRPSVRSGDFDKFFLCGLHGVDPDGRLVLNILHVGRQDCQEY